MIFEDAVADTPLYLSLKQFVSSDFVTTRTYARDVLVENYISHGTVRYAAYVRTVLPRSSAAAAATR